MSLDVYRLSWNITRACNFKCHYCCSTPQNRIESIIPTHKIIETLKATKKQWRIAITGGEPFIYPNFIELCKELTKHYKIRLETNLSINSSKVREFVNNVDTNMVDNMNISTHIEERERRNGVDEFIKNLSLLKKEKYKFLVSYVLHPQLIERFVKDFEYFQAAGIKLVPKPYKGIYKEKIYPEAYSEREKKLLSEYNTEFQIYPFNSLGIKCNAGRTLIRMDENGIFKRCVSEPTELGDVYKGVKLYDSAKACKVKQCYCFGHGLIEKTGILTRGFYHVSLLSKQLVSKKKSNPLYKIYKTLSIKK